MNNNDLITTKHWVYKKSFKEQFLCKVIRVPNVDYNKSNHARLYYLIFNTYFRILFIGV